MRFFCVKFAEKNIYCLIELSFLYHATSDKEAVLLLTYSKCKLNKLYSVAIVAIKYCYIFLNEDVDWIVHIR